MKIYLLYLDERKIKETTMEFAIEKLEGHGWYHKGLAKELLESGEMAKNPYCLYSINKEDLHPYTL